MADPFDLVGIHGAGDATPRATASSSSSTHFDTLPSTTAPSYHYPQSLALSHTSSIPVDQTRQPQARRTIPTEHTNLYHRQTPRRGPSPPSTASRSGISLSSMLTTTTSILTLPPENTFTLSIPCEFSPYLSCPLRFHHPAEWCNHCLDHYTQLLIPLPSQTLCWFCDRWKWKGKQDDREDVYESYLARMTHIAGEWEGGWFAGGEGRERVPRRDHFVLEHLWRWGVVSGEDKRRLGRAESEYFGRWARGNVNGDPGSRGRRDEAVLEVEGSRQRRGERGRWH